MAVCLEISLRQLERVFVEDCDWTPQQWLSQVRLWATVAPVLEGKLPKEFFRDFGFRSESGFFHAFKKYHRCATRVYLQIHLRTETDGFKRLKKCVSADKTLLNSTEIPQHLRALETLKRIPFRSEQLNFYFLRFQCRFKALSVA